jgi:parallel beta-helix repeat protein
MRTPTIFLPILLLIICSATVQAKIIHVPADSSTIQGGINGADEGDTVLVADGTYTGDGNRDIDFMGKAIVVMSENGPGVTIIDSQGGLFNAHRGFYFHSGEDSTSVVKGFTIRNGYHSEGGGIYCNSASSPMIVGNTITGNEADGYGGGIHCNASSSPIIMDNTITGNIVGDPFGYGFGGGISCNSSSSPTIVGNTITLNTSYDQGGGILIYTWSSPTITDNTITGNSTDYDGGGISCWTNTSPTITNNTISENSTVHGYGGGIFCQGSSAIIEGNTITENDANYGGGGINLRGDSPLTIVGNRIIGNSTGDPGSLGYGGGIYCDASDPTIEDNTIWLNWAYSDGGGIYFKGNSSSVIEGNTISENWADNSGGGIYCFENSSLTISRNTISENWAGEGFGGGIYCHGSSVDILGNTLTGNWADNGGGGIRCNNFSTARIFNSILWDDVAGFDEEISIDGSSSIVVHYSDVAGGWLGGMGNMDADPMFVLTDKQDYRLLWESPCIDSGHPSILDPDSTRSDMGAYFFDQDDYLTLYLTPDTKEVAPGSQLGVTYTVINRWGQPEPFWVLTQAILPGGNPVNILGPVKYTLPAGMTIQQHFNHGIPPAAPLGKYEYWTQIGLPPSTLYDEDRFTFRVVE